MHYLRSTPPPYAWEITEEARRRDRHLHKYDLRQVAVKYGRSVYLCIWKSGVFLIDDIPVILPHMVSSQSSCPSQEFSDSLKFGRITNPSPDQTILDENGRKTGDEERYSRTLKLIHTALSHLTGRDSFTHTTYSSALCPLYVRSQTSTSKTIPNNLHLE